MSTVDRLFEFPYALQNRRKQQDNNAILPQQWNGQLMPPKNSTWLSVSACVATLNLPPCTSWFFWNSLTNVLPTGVESYSADAAKAFPFFEVVQLSQCKTSSKFSGPVRWWELSHFLKRSSAPCLTRDFLDMRLCGQVYSVTSGISVGLSIQYMENKNGRLYATIIGKISVKFS